jgi:hypothetical protein
MVEGGG